MMNIIYDLSKELYDLTQWDGGKQFAFDNSYEDKWVRYIADLPKDGREYNLIGMTPLYTIEYMLTALPTKTQIRKNNQNAKGSHGHRWVGNYTAFCGVKKHHHRYEVENIIEHGETPTEALLRLAIKLVKENRI